MPVEVQDFDKPEGLAKYKTDTSKPENENETAAENTTEVDKLAEREKVSNETTNVTDTPQSDTPTANKSKSRKRKQELKPEPETTAV
ncbi:hypothetical protein [Mastigocladopsis repens]|uniref:hypothetical protein n=1 Tax=Mastigocladopsis repens TaxID=221287 RepID=UPI0002F28CE2|nr:hypothetical protein [Mastigocladopsis repens]